MVVFQMHLFVFGVLVVLLMLWDLSFDLFLWRSSSMFELRGIVLITLHDILFIILSPPSITVILSDLGGKIKRNLTHISYRSCFGGI